MTRLTQMIACLGTVLVAGFGLSGCGGTDADQRSAWREAGRQFLLQEEPSDAVQVIQLRETLGESSEQREVVLVGRIDGLSHSTWDPDRAAFMICDLSLRHTDVELDGAPKHDADNCPFCKAKAKKEFAAIALVEVVDQSGDVPSVDARTLLGLSDGQTVVVSGKATLDKLGTLVVQADKLFVRLGDGE